MLYDFAINIKMEQSKSVKRQCLQPEFLYLLDGCAEVQTDRDKVSMKEGDFLFLLPGQNCAFSAEDVSAVWLSLDFHFLYQHLGGAIWHLSCCSLGHRQEKSFLSLGGILRNLLIEYADHADRENARYLMLSAKLYLELEENFRGSNTVVDNVRDVDHWTTQVLDYVYMHYADRISLTDIAEEAYTSVSTLSRHFSKNMGVSFVDYLRRFRLNRVREALKYQKKSITQIALENGFQNSSAMTRAFIDEFKETPSEFRDNYQKSADKKEKRQETGSLKQLRKSLRKQFSDDASSRSGNEEISIEMAEDSGVRDHNQNGFTLYEDHLQILNIGPASQMTDGALEKQVLDLQRQFHFPYYRIWNLFTPDLIMVQPKTGRINYSRLDQILDFFVSHHMRLFLDLGRMTVLTRVNETKYIKEEKDVHFSSEEEWKSYLNRFLAHIVGRYGEKTAGSWIYEFSFFLNLHPYYEDKNYQVKNAWRIAWHSLKTIIPTARIAGPGLIATLDEESTKMLINDFLSSDCPPDLFTGMHFPYQSKIHVDADLKKIVRPDYMVKQIELIRKELNNAGYNGKYCVTDWNCSISNRNYIEDSCFRSTFLAKEYLRNRQSAVGFGIWYASDLISNYADSSGLLSGCAGILSRDGIRKPVYYALDFLKKLQGRVVASGENFIVTGYGQNNYQILCFNHSSLGPRYYLTEENDSTPEGIIRIFENEPRRNVRFQLNHIENGHYVIRQGILNAENGSLLQNWVSLGTPVTSREETDYLRQVTLPKLERETTYIQAESIELSLSLQQNELRFIEIIRQLE